MSAENGFLITEAKELIAGVTAQELEAHTEETEIHRKITIGTAEPTGGIDGDIYLKIATEAE